MRLVSLEVVAQRAARKLGISEQRVTDSTDVKPEGSSNVVTISATDESPDFAAKLANTLAQQYVAFQRSADQANVQQGLSTLRKRIAALDAAGSRSEARALEQRALKLETLRALQTGNAELVQPAPPKDPSSPKPGAQRSGGAAARSARRPAARTRPATGPISACARARRSRTSCAHRSSA